ncbi:hypothetical protein PBRA_006072, partial [Plasmodiophora brassicae]
VGTDQRHTVEAAVHRFQILVDTALVSPQLEPDLVDRRLHKVDQWARRICDNPTKPTYTTGTVTVAHCDIVRLRGECRLSDAVLAACLDLIVKRDHLRRLAMPGIFPTCAAVDPGFYHKLMENGKLSYDGVGRWTARWARIGIRDLIFFPVLIAEEPHWVLVAVHPKLQLVEVYDSLSDRPRGTLGTNIIHFLQQEHLGKRGRPCHGQWDHRLASRIPKQSNGHDCGVFVIMYADYLANTAAMTFTDADMPYFRRRRTVEIERQAMLDCLTPPNTQEYAAPIYVDDQQQISSHLRPSITSATSSSSDCGATFRPTDLRSEGDNTANR